MEDKDNLWTLGSPMTTLKKENTSALIATNIDIWQKNADRRRKNKKLRSVSNVKRKGILQRTVKEHSQ